MGRAESRPAIVRQRRWSNRMAFFVVPSLPVARRDPHRTGHLRSRLSYKSLFNVGKVSDDSSERQRRGYVILGVKVQMIAVAGSSNAGRFRNSVGLVPGGGDSDRVITAYGLGIVLGRTPVADAPGYHINHRLALVTCPMIARNVSDGSGRNHVLSHGAWGHRITARDCQASHWSHGGASFVVSSLPIAVTLS